MQIIHTTGKGRMGFFHLNRSGRTRFLVLFLSLISFSQAFAFTQPEDSSGRKIREKSSFTPEQKARMKELRTQHQKEILAFRNQIREKEVRLQTLETADKADMNAIYQVIDEIQGLKGKMMKSKAAHKQEIRKLLTPEQRLEFDLKPGKGHKGHHPKRHKMGHSGPKHVE